SPYFAQHRSRVSLSPLYVPEFHTFPGIGPGSQAIFYMCMECKRRYRSKKGLEKHVRHECGGRK
ncbi:GSCOCG00002795001-RA-CDS, partial [Cotesia congregata]